MCIRDRQATVQTERQASLGQQGYWDLFWDADDIFYGHVLGFKGMERRALVLCVNEDGTCLLYTSRCV